LRVPDDATAALSIAQAGLDRIWVGTAPEGGDVGLAYTDDGGASWTDVKLPLALNTTSEELLAAADAGGDELLLVAVSGDRVAATIAWGRFNASRKLFVSADAGDNWTTVPLEDPTGHNGSTGINGAELFVLADHRLVVAVASDYYTQQVLVSSSASDWSQLEDSSYEPPDWSHVDVNQQGILANYGRSLELATLTTDLTNWWTIPGLTYR
jgi:hypothetical protein